MQRDVDRPLRIVFWGSGPIGEVVLQQLVCAPLVDIACVATRPDRAAGRGQRLRPCPVKEYALQKGLPVYTLEKQTELVETLRRVVPDLGVVADYGAFLPESVTELPRLRTINVHPSLLPKYRGAAPVQWALARGETETGVTILYVTKEMDAGDIIRQAKVPIEPEEDAVSLSRRLAEIGGRLLLEALEDFRRGRVKAVPQDHSRATFAPKLTKKDGRIDWKMAARDICNRVRGFQPWPGCYCYPDGEHGDLLHIRKARVEDLSGRPGEVVAVEKDGPVVAGGEGAVRLLRVQPAGKRVMSGYEYAIGHRVQVGDMWQ